MSKQIYATKTDTHIRTVARIIFRNTRRNKHFFPEVQNTTPHKVELNVDKTTEAARTYRGRYGRVPKSTQRLASINTCQRNVYKKISENICCGLTFHTHTHIKRKFYKDYKGRFCWHLKCI